MKDFIGVLARLGLDDGIKAIVLHSIQFTQELVVIENGLSHTSPKTCRRCYGTVVNSGLVLQSGMTLIVAK